MEKGEKIFEIVSSNCARFINELKKVQVTVKNRELLKRPELKGSRELDLDFAIRPLYGET